jgi:hypothetical protein
MAFQIAHKTLAAIDTCLEADQGGSFRVWLGKVIPHMKDAYRAEEEGFRSHLGASVIGKPCARQIWYGFRWAKRPKFAAKMVRLFNRGHLEEARFIAMLLAIGVQVYQQDANGNQYRISDVGGHFGGSGDGIGVGIPDLAPNQPCVLEFKTHGEKPFKKLVTQGVKEAKPEHYTQMQIYMRKMGIPAALYAAVNKNTDEIHLEMVYLDAIHADQMIDRGRQIIMMRVAPEKLNDSPGWYECTYCEMKDVCHYDAKPAVNCRTCYYSEVKADGTWRCKERANVISNDGEELILSKEAQLAGCGSYLKF